MGLNHISHSFGQGIGKFVLGARRVLSWPGSTLSNAMQKLHFALPSARVRSIVTEELSRLMAEQTELTSTELQERLRVMAEAIESLQNKITELSARGPVSQADVLRAMGSLKAAASLTDDERAILAGVFRQNIALQKPDLVDTAAEQHCLRVISS